MHQGYSIEAQIGTKLAKARRMHPKRHAGARADGHGEWRLKPRKGTFQKQQPKKDKNKKER